MIDHEGALLKALIAWLRDDGTIKSLLGEPARIWDQPPEGQGFPHLLIGRSESRPISADGCGIEHSLTLSCVSRFAGTEEARAVCAAMRARLHDATLEGDGVRTISLRVTFVDVFRSADLHRAYAVIRLRAVTEEV